MSDKLSCAEPAAPSSDDVEKAFGVLLGFVMDGPIIDEVETLRAHIATLEADNKRLREALQKYASAKVTCEFVDGDSRTFEVHESCEKWAQEALSRANGKAGE